MKKLAFIFCLVILSNFSFSQKSTVDTLQLQGTILKLPKERFAQSYCITESECYVLKTEKEEYLLNTSHPFTLKLAQDNLNKKIQARGIYRIKEGKNTAEFKNCYHLNLIPIRVRKNKN